MIPPFLKTALCDLVRPTAHHLIDETATFADLGLDCLDAVAIALTVEDELGFVMRDAELEAWGGVAEVLATIERARVVA